MIFGAGFFVRRASGGGGDTHAGALLVVAAGWAVYAIWEWLVMTKTPEANIRVDLLLIWPVLLVLTAWGIFRAFKA